VKSFLLKEKAMTLVKVSRKTLETSIELELDLFPQKKEVIIETEVGFLNHMLNLFSHHGGFTLKLKAKGDLEVDFHHTVEDIGIVLGEAISKALGSRENIYRYGEATIPMQEALTQAVVDLAKRPYLYFKVNFPSEKIGNFDTELLKEFFYALTVNAQITLHIRNFYGENSHHIAESIFKAFAYAFRRALTPVTEVRSTKGTL